MKSITYLSCICLLATVLSACAPAASVRVPASPFYEDYDFNYLTPSPYPYYYVYPGYDTVYHPGYYVVPSRGWH